MWFPCDTHVIPMTHELPMWLMRDPDLFINLCDAWCQMGTSLSTLEKNMRFWQTIKHTFQLHQIFENWSNIPLKIWGKEGISFFLFSWYYLSLADKVYLMMWCTTHLFKQMTRNGVFGEYGQVGCMLQSSESFDGFELDFSICGMHFADHTCVWQLSPGA